MSRVISWFSCGVASAVATKLALLKNPDLIIARCIVFEEHPDNDRFASDCEEWFGKPITRLVSEKYGGSVYRVIEKTRFISGVSGAPCTLRLKKQVRMDFEEPGDGHVFGYCAEEQERFDRFLDANNIIATAPLIERGLTHQDCLAIIEKSGIDLPVMYKLGYKHNNCIGCVKATGAGYWNKIRQDFPEYFVRMSYVSRNLGARMVRLNGERIFLDELKSGSGDYKAEPEIQCGIFCEMADREING